MAATLIDVFNIQKSQNFQSIISTPVFDRFEAKETIICETQKTIKIVVYLAYQGKVSPYYTHVFPYNQEDIANFTL